MPWNRQLWIEQQIENERELFNEAIAYGQPFTDSKRRCSGFIHEGRRFVTEQWSGFITGSKYVKQTCDCIPWEGCEKCYKPDWTEVLDEEARQHLLSIEK